MKRFIVLALSAISSNLSIFAQSYNQNEDISGTIFLILILLLSVIMIIHMVYELFVQKDPFASISLEEMKTLRQAEGLPETMSQDEFDQCCKLVEDEFNLWTPIPNSENDVRLFSTKKGMDHAIETFNQIRTLRPTNQELIESINSYLSLATEGRKREFTGSKVLLVLIAIIGALSIFVAGKDGGFQMAIFFVVMGAIYYAASLTPQFVLINREINGNKGIGCMGAVFAGLGGMILGARTVKTTTKWSDGTTSTDYDNSEHGVAWFIALFVTLFVLCTLIIWSFFNYLRNYVFYY